MDRQLLIDRVKTKLDELTPFDEGLAVALPNADVKPIEKYIDELLDESAKEVQLRSPLHLNEPKCALVNPIQIYELGDGVGEVDCPLDFLRLYSFKMKGWQREVEYPISEGHPNYKLQNNKHTRGGMTKPVVVITQKRNTTNPMGLTENKDFDNNEPIYKPKPYKKILRYYSVKGVVHKIEKFFYIPIRPAEQINNLLIELLLWVCTRKVMEVLGLKNYEIAEKEVQQLLTLENY